MFRGAIRRGWLLFPWFCFIAYGVLAEDWKPYSPPCTEREDVFAFVEKPKVKALGNDKYEITFATKANCDVTVGIVDSDGKVVRHLGAGVLGPNAPAPFSASGGKQTIYWDGKDDLDVYHKEPGKLKVRVMLGLKPEFDRTIGWHPKQFPGGIIALGADVGGVYVISGTGGQGWRVRAFDHDGKYERTVFPPPANVPLDKLGGMGFIEYEPGRRALQAPEVRVTVSDRGNWFPTQPFQSSNVQPAVSKGRIYYANDGSRTKAYLFYLNTDSTTDAKGVFGFPWRASKGPKTPTHPAPRLAASPDGKHLYLSGAIEGRDTLNYVLRFPADEPMVGDIFWGATEPGSDDRHLNKPDGVACDAQGRVYVCDVYNNRMQVISPEGKLLKSIAIKRPNLVHVHPKTGAIYVLHATSVEGKIRTTVTKLSSFDEPSVAISQPLAGGSADTAFFCLDAWASKPRIWLVTDVKTDMMQGSGAESIQIFEETGKGFQEIANFAVEAEKEAGHPNLMAAAKQDKVVCDPVREVLYYKSRIGVVRFDLRTGKYLDTIRLPGVTDDIAFDKRGFMHCHFNPGFYTQGVGRQDPDRKNTGHGKFGSFAEVPYDYGVTAKGTYAEEWSGVLPTKCQPGAKFFQDGVGANMRGDVVVESNIYYAPKIEDEVKTQATKQDMSAFMVSTREQYARFQARVQEMLKRGEAVYHIPYRPGWPGHGGTAWTFDFSGEVRQESAVVGGRLINGVAIDMDGHVYCAFDSPRVLGGKEFLAGKGGTLGADHPEFGKANRNPFICTYMKASKEGGRLITKSAPIRMEPWPARPMDVRNGWVEGAEWLYAGAGPIVCVTCSCPNMRAHLDWYGRSFVPEPYRHSFGILDSNGNLLLHMGKYGNADSGRGPDSPVKVGGDEIALCHAPYISGTDNYVCFNDYSRVVVVKLNYHAEETVGIQ